MWPFKQIKAWFAWPEYRDSLAALVAYLPVGDLSALVMWRVKWVPYKSDEGDGGGLDNYNGADLTIKAKGGDCESIAAVYSETVRQWSQWESWHVCFVFTRTDGKTYEAHDVAFFVDDKGRMGWIDGGIYYGDYKAFLQAYDLQGWHIIDWWQANDIGEKF